jgi:hypothetical protein
MQIDRWFAISHTPCSTIQDRNYQARVAFVLLGGKRLPRVQSL